MATDGELEQWVAPGFDVSLEYPTAENSKYRATIEEFDLSAEGNTLDEAYEAVVTRLVRVALGRILRGEPLPDRSAWLREHGALSDRNNV